MNNLKQDEIQKQAVESWLNANKKGTFQVSTGVGKTFMFLHCLHSMPKNDDIHFFLAEVVDRENDLKKDITKYDKIFGTTTRKDYDLKFLTYQSAYKMSEAKVGLVGADEIHNALTPEYSKFFFNNTYDAIVGLSATIDANTSYMIDDKIVRKKDLLDKIAPVCFKYTLSQAKDDGVGRNLNVYVIQQNLDSVNKTIKAGRANKPFYQTEKAAYDYWDREHKKSWYLEDEDLKSLKIRITSTKRSNLLFNLPSKIEAVKQLLPMLKGKTILFGNSLDSLLKITKNVVSSRYTEDQNKAIRDNFDSDKINLIGSFKKLRQGANLVGLTNAIIMSYYSSEVHAVQQWGRLRKDGDKDGNVFILLTMNTQEEVWFTKMTENLTDFNIIYCDSVKDCIQKYKLNEKN
ncbi:MAG TPA: DEAD/DEAH box helicase family protein [Allosphingosinicella sp.]|jgi:superfamily II DNA or RNA helicase